MPHTRPQVCCKLSIDRRMLIMVKQFHQVLRSRLPDTPLVRYQALILHIHQREQAPSQTDLVQYLGIDKASMVRILDELGDAGLIRRTPRENDRRCYQIQLTETALNQLPTLEKGVQELQDEMFAGFSNTERETFLNLLTRMQENLRNTVASITENTLHA